MKIFVGAGERREIDREKLRVPIPETIDVVIEDFMGFIQRFASNISKGGVFLATTEGLEVGTPLELHFRLEDNYPLIHARGTVIWVRHQPLGTRHPAGMGVRFDWIDDEGQRLINKIVSNHIKDGGKPFRLDEPGAGVATGDTGQITPPAEAAVPPPAPVLPPEAPVQPPIAAPAAPVVAAEPLPVAPEPVPQVDSGTEPLQELLDSHPDEALAVDPEPSVEVRMATEVLGAPVASTDSGAEDAVADLSMDLSANAGLAPGMERAEVDATPLLPGHAQDSLGEVAGTGTAPGSGALVIEARARQRTPDFPQAEAPDPVSLGEDDLDLSFSVPESVTPPAAVPAPAPAPAAAPPQIDAGPVSLDLSDALSDLEDELRTTALESAGEQFEMPELEDANQFGNLAEEGQLDENLEYSIRFDQPSAGFLFDELPDFPHGNLAEEILAPGSPTPSFEELPRAAEPVPAHTAPPAAAPRAGDMLSSPLDTGNHAAPAPEPLLHHAAPPSTAPVPGVGLSAPQPDILFPELESKPKKKTNYRRLLLMGLLIVAFVAGGIALSRFGLSVIEGMTPEEVVLPPLADAQEVAEAESTTLMSFQAPDKTAPFAIEHNIGRPKGNVSKLLNITHSGDEDGDETVVVLWGDGAFSLTSVAYSHLSGETERDVIRILGLEQAWGFPVVRVASPHVSALRFGFVEGRRFNEAQVVADLASTEARLRKIVLEGDRLLLHFGSE